jgi:hypothetical protein
VRKIVPAEAARQPLAPDLGIGEVVDLARKSLRLASVAAIIGLRPGRIRTCSGSRPSAAASRFRSA